MERLVSEYYYQDLYYQKAMLSSLLELFVLLARSFRKTHLEASDDIEKSQLVMDIINYIHQNIATVTLRDIAKQFQYSDSYISKLIKLHTGENFSDIMIFLKLEQAKKYLETSNMKINEIATCLGFSDSSHFNRVFKNSYNLSPSEYRKQSYSER